MSANHKPHNKMCKTPPKNTPHKTAKLPELGTYEILNTNCTMVGSNNLTLDSKLNSAISYPNSQIKLCAKPIKSPDILLKKPQSPRGDFLHNTMVQNVNNITKFTNFTAHRNLIPSSPTPNTSNFIQQTIRTSKTSSQSYNNGLGMSPSPSYSNPSPGSYPNSAVSPYNVQISSPANSVSSISNSAIKSPVPSPQNIRPPTPQPILPQAFQQLPTLSGQNLVQIIHAPSNSTQATYSNHPVLTQRTIIAPPSNPQQLSGTPLLKIKPPQNILPKPPSSNISTSGVNKNTVVSRSVGPTAASGGVPGGGVPTAQLTTTGQSVGTGMGQLMLPGQSVPGLLLNQMPLLMGGGNMGGSGGVQLILRPGTPTAASAAGKLAQGAGGAPQLVLQPGSAPHILQQPQPGQGQRPGPPQHLHQPQQLVRVLTSNGMLQSLPLNALGPTYIMQQQPQVQSLAQPPQQSPVSVQSMTQTTVAKPQQTFIQSQVVPQSVSVHQVQMDQLPPPKKKPKKKKKNKEPKMDLANIMKLSGIGDDDDVLFESDASESAVACDPPLKMSKPPDPPQIHTSEPPSHPTDFPKRIGNIHISALNQENGPMSKQTPLSRTDTILTDKQTFGQSQISVQQSLSDINAINQNLAQIGLINQNQNFITGGNHLVNHMASNHHENHNLANILQALNHGQNLQNFSLLNGSSLQNLTAVSQPTNIPGLTTFQNSTGLQTSTYQKFPMSMSGLTSSDPVLTGLNKPQPGFPQKQNTSPITHFNIPNIPNIQVQNFCGNNQNLILNQLNQAGNILTPNIPNFSGNITINNSLIPNMMPNFLPNLVQSAPEMSAQFGNSVQRTGGFKLALSEDGRLILQHDPTLNQDIQSQLLLQSIFGINLQGGNLVLTSVNNTPSLPPPKPLTISEPLKKTLHPQSMDHATTKTTNIIQHAIPSITSVKTEPQPSLQPPQGLNPEGGPPNNYSYIVNLTPDQLETLKRNGQLTVNGQTIFMHRPPNMVKEEKNIIKSPKVKTPKKRNSFDKNAKAALQEHLNIKSQNIEQNKIIQTNLPNQTIINSLQSPINKTIHHQPISSQQIIISSTVTEPKHTITDSNFPPNSQNQPKNHQKLNENHLMQKQIKEPIKEPIPIKSEPEMIFPANQNLTENKPQIQFVNGLDSNINVEQFLTNLNINPSNLNQLISQKLGQDLPSGVDPKIVNISHGPNAGQIVAKIDISSDNTHNSNSGVSSGGNENPPAPVVGSNDISNMVLPPLISMGVKQEVGDVFNSGSGKPQADTTQLHPPPPPTLPPPIQPQPTLHLPILPQVHSQSQTTPVPVPVVHSQPTIQPAISQVHSQPSQMPALIIGGDMPPNLTPSVPAATPGTVPPEQSTSKVYQRVQTIQLTPQKQQLLKSVQLQIHALSARLQQKPTDGSNPGDQTEIHTALRHLFLEQQKILATGKVIPNITQPISSIASSCTMDTIATQSVPVTAASKTNGTFLTSLLQQPVVSHNQTQKVYYHHGNQIIAINPQLSNSFPTLSTSVTSISAPPLTSTCANLSLPTLVPTSQSSSTQTVPITIPVATNKSLNKKLTPQCIAPNIQTIQPNNTKQMTTQLIPNQQHVEVQSVKEVQVGQIQSGKEIQQSIETAKIGVGQQMSPSKRIVKPSYSKAQLIEQQLQTDQNGAMNPDITTPFSSKADAVKRLVRYHCYKQPVLSPKDLSKADEIFELTARHFIDKFRCMVSKYQSLLLKESMRENQTSELMMIDRMFLAEEQQSFHKFQSDVKLQNELELSEPPAAPNPPPPTSESSFDPSFIKTELPEGSERFEEESNPDFNIKCGLNYFGDESSDSNNFNPEFDEFIGMEKNQEKLKSTSKNIESYNTTKIIGNFEIEINNKQNFRQKDKNEIQKEEDYDEWLCIQRELGVFPENKEDQKTSESTSETLTSETKKNEKSGHKRTSSDRNSCLESLKKYRVEKHNQKVKKTGSIIGEVKFEVRIEHKKVFPDKVKSETSSLKRAQFESCDFISKRAKQLSELPSTYIKKEGDTSLEIEGEPSETFDRSIDEQVQSAIDSILNLQQITSMSDPGDGKSVLTCKKDEVFPVTNTEDTLDEAVNSILS